MLPLYTMYVYKCVYTHTHINIHIYHTHTCMHTPTHFTADFQSFCSAWKPMRPGLPFQTCPPTCPPLPWDLKSYKLQFTQWTYSSLIQFLKMKQNFIQLYFSNRRFPGLDLLYICFTSHWLVFNCTIFFSIICFFL